MVSQVFTLTTVNSLAFVLGIAIIAFLAVRWLLPKDIRWQDKYTFVWLVFDALIHFTFEGAFLWLSVFGRTVNTSSGMFAEMLKEYTMADARWGTADPTIVSLEILTVLGAGPLCCWILKQIVSQDPARFYWIVVLGTAEIYGGWMTFCPEWLTGSAALRTDNFLHLWVYLFLMNGIWVVIPLWLMCDAYTQITDSLKLANTTRTSKKAP